MAVLDALQNAALMLMSRKPTTFYGSTETLEMELAYWANEVAQDVAKYQDWQALIAIAELDGDSATELFDLPTDYDRQMLDSDVQTPLNLAWGYTPFTDLNSFLTAQARGWNPYPGGWVIYGGKLRFSPAPQGAAVYPYISSYIVRDSAGGRKAAFTADTDQFLLPERLITLGVIWRWRENKKLDATGDQEAFVKALDEYAAKDSGSKILRFGGRTPLRGMGRLAYTGIAY